MVKNAYRAWLPEEALKACPIDSLLSDIVRAWSASWFARANARPLATVASLPTYADLGGGGTWMMMEHSIGLGVSAASRPVLASMMLDIDQPEEPVTDADRRLMDALTTLCLDDLCERVATMFNRAGERWTTKETTAMPHVDEPRGCGIGVEMRHHLIRFVASGDAVIDLVKSRLPTPPAREKLHSVAAALANQEVTLSAALGRSTITLADMAGLSEGDVLVFDTDARSPLPLAVDGVPVSRGRCTVTEKNERLHLKLFEPVR